MNMAPPSTAVRIPQRGGARVRLAAALLVMSCLVFAVAAYARTAGAPHFSSAFFWDNVRAELDPVVDLWVLAAVTIGLANALIAVAVLLLARGVDGASGWLRASVAASIVTLAACAVYVFGYLATVRFETPTLGGEPLFWVAYVAGFVATVAVALALAFVAVEWRRTGIIRSRSLVIASFVVAAVSIALPPFVVGLLGLVFAVIRLRRLAASRDSGALS